MYIVLLISVCQFFVDFWYLVCSFLWLSHGDGVQFAVAAAAITAAATILGSILNAEASAGSSSAALKAQQQNNLWQAQLVDAQNQANLKLYRESFADSMEKLKAEQVYNSAEQQVQRLRDAGLNPALAFGSGNMPTSVNLPSAPEMKAPTVQSAPYEAYSDSFISGLVNGLPAMADTISKFADVRSKQIDNQYKEEMSKRQLENLRVSISKQLEDVKLSRAERKRLAAELDSINLMNDLTKAKYDDSIKLFKLTTDAQEIQNRIVQEQNSRDAARLAIEQFEAQTNYKLTNAKINQIQVLSNLAINQDWRDSQSHVAHMNMAAMDEVLKRLNLDEKRKDMLFKNIMQQSEILHNELKDVSFVNKWCEAAFGLGFRDLGMALRALFSK